MFESKSILYEYFLTKEDVFNSFQEEVVRLRLSAQERLLLEWAKKFKQDVGRMPLLNEVSLKKGVVFLDTGIDGAVLYRELLEFVKAERMKEFVLETSERIDTGRVVIEEVYDQAKKIVENFAGAEKRLVRFADGIAGIIDRMVTQHQEEVIPTGIAGLDKVLGGGLAKGEFLCTIAPTGRGKTMWLINMAYGAIVNRRKTLFLTMELSEEVINARIVRRVSKLSRKEIRLDKEKAQQSVDLFVNIAEDLSVIYQKPHMVSVPAVSVLVDKFKREFGGLDLLLIDYLDRLKLPVKDPRLGYGYLVDELRDLAVEKNIAVASATQANRASLSAVVVTEEFVGESFKKIENSDVAISLNRSESDEKKNAGRIVVLKNREYGGKGAQIPVRIDFEKSLITDYV